MFMYIVAFMAVGAIVSNLDAVSHINTMAFAFGFTHTTANTIQGFHNDTSKQGEKTYVFLAFPAILQQECGVIACMLYLNLI